MIKKHFIVHLEPVDVAAEDIEEAKEIYKSMKNKPDIMRVVPADINLLNHKQKLQEIEQRK